MADYDAFMDIVLDGILPEIDISLNGTIAQAINESTDKSTYDELKGIVERKAGEESNIEKKVNGLILRGDAFLPNCDTDSEDCNDCKNITNMIRRGIFKILFLCAPHSKDVHTDQRQIECESFIEAVMELYKTKQGTEASLQKTVPIVRSVSDIKNHIDNFFRTCEKDRFPIVFFMGHGDSKEGGRIVLENEPGKSEYMKTIDFVLHIISSFRSNFKDRVHDNSLRIVLPQCYGYKIAGNHETSLPEDIRVSYLNMDYRSDTLLQQIIQVRSFKKEVKKEFMQGIIKSLDRQQKIHEDAVFADNNALHNLGCDDDRILCNRLMCNLFDFLVLHAKRDDICDEEKQKGNDFVNKIASQKKKSHDKFVGVKTISEVHDKSKAFIENCNKMRLPLIILDTCREKGVGGQKLLLKDHNGDSSVVDDKFLTAIIKCFHDTCPASNRFHEQDALRIILPQADAGKMIIEDINVVYVTSISKKVSDSYKQHLKGGGIRYENIALENITGFAVGFLKILDYLAKPGCRSPEHDIPPASKLPKLSKEVGAQPETAYINASTPAKVIVFGDESVEGLGSFMQETDIECEVVVETSKRLSDVVVELYHSIVSKVTRMTGSPPSSVVICYGQNDLGDDYDSQKIDFNIEHLVKIAKKTKKHVNEIGVLPVPPQNDEDKQQRADKINLSLQTQCQANSELHFLEIEKTDGSNYKQMVSDAVKAFVRERNVSTMVDNISDDPYLLSE